MASFLVLIILCILTTSLAADAGPKLLKYSIGPVSECSGAPTPLGDIVKTCYRRCLMEPEPRKKITVTIHQSEDASAGPKMVECAKVIQEQTFTRTWTFSDIASPLSHRFGKVTEEECKRAILENCPSYDCNHREKDSLEEDYHYASDTTVKRETISLMTVPSSLSVDRGSIVLSPISSSASFEQDESVGFDDGKVYLWKDGATGPTCPFKPVQSYGCDEYQDPDGSRYYLCSGGRFSVTPQEGEKDVAHQSCKDLKLSAEGFLYDIKKAEDETSEKHGRLFITPLANMDANYNYLIHKIQQVTTHLDSEICTNQCEILALESRVSSSQRPVVRVGLAYYLLDTRGGATKCRTLSGCKLAKPTTLCGNPPRVGVVCAGTSGLWNPLLPYIVPGGVCLKPDSAEKLTFSLGTEVYIVDEDLSIMANRSYSHGVYPTSFSDFHQGGIKLSIESLKQLRVDWFSAKDQKGGTSKTETTTKKLNAPTNNVGSKIIGWFSSLSETFNNIEHTIGMVVIIGATLLFVWFGMKIVYLSRGGRVIPDQTYAMVRRRSSEDRRGVTEWI